MRTFLGSIFTFILERARILFLLISILILIEGMLYIFFPKKIKRIVEECPLYLFRLLGGLIVILGLILIYLYKEILIPLWR